MKERISVCVLYECCNTRADIQGIYITRRRRGKSGFVRTGSLSITTVDATVTMRRTRFNDWLCPAYLHLNLGVCVSSVTYPNRRSHVSDPLKPHKPFYPCSKSGNKAALSPSFYITLQKKYIMKKHFQQNIQASHSIVVVIWKDHHS